MIRKFLLHEPDTVEATSFLLSKYGADARVLAGGTELFLELKRGLVSYKHVINIKTISGLDRVGYDEEKKLLRIGSLVTHRVLEKSKLVNEKFPLLAEVERQIGNIRVRNVGTLGGNLCLAEPYADPGTPLLALGARVKVRNAKRERELGLGDFFVRSYETALEPDEILTEIKVPRLAENAIGVYLRFCPAGRLIVGVAGLITFTAGQGIEDLVLTVGCVHSKPIRAMEVESLLHGRPVDEALARLEQAGELAARISNPVDDLRGSAEYKRHIVKVLTKRVFREACRRRAIL